MKLKGEEEMNKEEKAEKLSVPQRLYILYLVILPFAGFGAAMLTGRFLYFVYAILAFILPTMCWVLYLVIWEGVINGNLPDLELKG